MNLVFIKWNVDPIIVDLGFFSLRYYTLLFGFGIVLAAWYVRRILQEKGFSDDTFFTLFYYVFFGIVIGARLGHCLFYEPDYYLHHPLEMILPFRFVNGEFTVTGYQGLASHGGAVGVIIALFIFCRRHKQNMLQLLDYIAIAAPLTAAFIRLGNLMNSEIVGEVTTVPWAFQFMRLDGLPRHPAQLYEALAYLLLFFINVWIYNKKKGTLHPGFFVGLTLTYIFTYRFFIEFLKINQVAFEDQIRFNMGQLLSIPYMLAGIYLMFFHKNKINKARI
ncbi:MAG: prolipoprotein diacylglyceryl transferase [Tannerellaceae bacterium]|nr:prolipoprotein diacylglyceryl transferase [Tannerellaceae bacterium]